MSKAIKATFGAMLVAVALLALAVPAAMASPRTGFLEVCKQSDSTAPVTGPFTFTIDGKSVTVATGGCSADMQVPAGNNTVVEASNAYTAVTKIDTIPESALVSSNLSTRVSVVNVPAGDISSAATVEYTNKEVFGHLEICKAQALGAGLTGSYTFKISGAMGFTDTQTVPVGACSNSIQVPAGVNEVDEIGSNNTDVVGISTIPSNALVASNLAAGTSSVFVAPGTDVNNETIATFVNDSSRLKICKIAGDYSLDGTVYSFTANGETVQAVAEPAPGGCALVPTPFPGGTKINIQEGIVPGTAVSDISVSDNRAVPGSTDLADRSVSVVLGSGETVVSYTNKVAEPGLLKVCKNAGPGVSLGQEFSFAVGGKSVQVPAGYCAIAGVFPFNSTQTITEAATSGLTMIGGATDPASNMVSDSLSGADIQTLIGAGVNEVTFTNGAIGTPVLPPNSGGGMGSGNGGAPAPTTIPTTTAPMPVQPMPVVEPIHASNRCIVIAKLVGRTLVLRAKGNAAVCNVLLRELNGKGVVIARATRHLHHGQTVHIKLGRKVQHVRTSIL